MQPPGTPADPRQSPTAELKLLRQELAEKNKIINDLGLPHLLQEQKLLSDITLLDKELGTSMGQLRDIQEELKNTAETIQLLEGALLRQRQQSKKIVAELRKTRRYNRILKISCLGCSLLLAGTILGWWVQGSLVHKDQMELKARGPLAQPGAAKLPPAENNSSPPAPPPSPAAEEAGTASEGSGVTAPSPKPSAEPPRGPGLSATDLFAALIATVPLPDAVPGTSSSQAAPLTLLAPPTGAGRASQPPRGTWLLSSEFEDLITGHPTRNLPHRRLGRQVIGVGPGETLRAAALRWRQDGTQVVELCSSDKTNTDFSSASSLTIIVFENTWERSLCPPWPPVQPLPAEVNLIGISQEGHLAYGHKRSRQGLTTLQTWPAAVWQHIQTAGWEKALATESSFFFETEVQGEKEKSRIILPGFGWLPGGALGAPIYAQDRSQTGGGSAPLPSAALIPGPSTQGVLASRERGRLLKLTSIKRESPQ